MSLIKCNECGHNVSIKASECPECGAPITLQEEHQKDYISIKVNKLSAHPVSIIFTIILFLILIGLVSSNLIFLKTIRGDFTLQQASISIYYQEYIYLYSTIITNTACISSILSCISKKLVIPSKIGYLFNVIITIVLFFNLYTNNIRVGICYFIILLINTILFILPIKYIMKSEETIIEKKKEQSIKKKNKYIEEKSLENIFSKRKIITTSIILLIEIISVVVILLKNNNDIYKETIIQANSDFQIRIINNYINIRSSANIESKVLGSVNKGDVYNVLDVIGGTNYIWYKIDYKGQKGYIASPRSEAYIEELYKDKLVVNIFCSTDNEDCGYLMEFILKYQKSTAKAFLIQYHDLKKESTITTYNKLLEYYDIEESVPLIVIGNNKITNYTKDSEFTLVEVIEEEINTTNNIVIEIKKGNELPKKEK